LLCVAPEADLCIPAARVTAPGPYLKAWLPRNGAAVSPFCSGFLPGIGDWHFGAYRLSSILNSEIDTWRSVR